MATSQQFFKALLCLFFLLSCVEAAFKSDLIEGTYNLESSDNFLAYLKALKVNFFVRQAASLAQPEVKISKKCGNKTDPEVNM